jgi:hypothetical protein
MRGRTAHQPIKDTIITVGGEKHLHKWQQPLSEAQYFVEKLCPLGGLVCDIALARERLPAQFCWQGAGGGS